MLRKFIKNIKIVIPIDKWREERNIWISKFSSFKFNNRWNDILKYLIILIINVNIF